MENTFILTETEFLQLLYNGEAKNHRNLHLHYRNFILKVAEVSKNRHHAIHALLFVEVEISHILSQAEREEINNTLTEVISKALAFVRSTISNIKDSTITLSESDEQLESVNLEWTASKTDLIELAYAFKVAECFGSKASVKDIVTKLAKTFKVEMPENYIYKKYNEIRVRAKNSRTYFLDSLGEKFRGFLKKLDVQQPASY